ncbi:hypothetical protein FPV67DRAFT_1671123 [Lyophyllum atratum]|nr:hypothetical protein FPV67DRAFT_1671123 [Lyophyllum atratum]
MHNESRSEGRDDVEMIGTSDRNSNIPKDSGTVDVAMDGALDREAPNNPEPIRRVFPGTFPGYAESMIEDPSSTTAPAPSAATVPVRKKGVDLNRNKERLVKEPHPARPTPSASMSFQRSGVPSASTSGRTRINWNRVSPPAPHGSNRPKPNWNAISGASRTGAAVATDSVTRNEPSSRCAKSLAPGPPARPTTAVLAKRPLPQDDASKSTSGSERKRVYVETPDVKKLWKNLGTATKKCDELEEELVIARQATSAIDARMTDLQKKHQEILTDMQSRHDEAIMESKAAREGLQRATEAREAELKEWNTMSAQLAATTQAIPLPEHHVASQTEHADVIADLYTTYDDLCKTSNAEQTELREEVKRVRTELTEKTKALEDLQKTYDEACDRYADQLGNFTGSFQRQRTFFRAAAQSAVQRAARAVGALSVTVQVTEATCDHQAALAALTKADLEASLNEARTKLDTALTEGRKIQTQRDVLLRDLQTVQTQLRDAQTNAIEVQTQLLDAQTNATELTATKLTATTSIKTLNRQLRDIDGKLTGVELERDQALSSVTRLQNDLAKATAESNDLETRVTNTEKQRDDALNSAVLLKQDIRAVENKRDKLQTDLGEAQAAYTTLRTHVAEVTDHQEKSTTSIEELEVELQEKNEELTELRQQHDEGRQRVTELEDNLAQANAKSDGLKSRVADIEKQRDEAKSSWDKVQRDLEQAAEAMLASTQKDINELKSQLQEAKTALEKEEGLHTALGKARSQVADASKKEKETQAKLNISEQSLKDATKARDDANRSLNKVQHDLEQAKTTFASTQAQHTIAINELKSQLQDAKTASEKERRVFNEQSLKDATKARRETASEKEKEGLETVLGNARSQVADAEKDAQKKFDKEKEDFQAIVEKEFNRREQLLKDATEARDQAVLREQTQD